MACDRSVPAGRLAPVLVGCLALTACVTDDSKKTSASTPLFRADIGEISGGVAPGPHAVWYVPGEPVRFVKVGVAHWADERPRHGWLARLVRGPASRGDAEPVAIAAAGLGLPTPSRVQVTNVATGHTIILRVDGTARLQDAIVRLPAVAAQDLGADARQPLLVRLRYLAPTMAYEGHAPLSFPLRGPSAARVGQAAEPPPPLMVAALDQPTPKPAPQPSSALRTATLPPSELRGGVFRVQAGAFAILANAERAAAVLAPAGAITIVPLQQDGRTLYRVVVSARQAGDAAAERLRARVAQTGFPDAWVLSPL